MYCQGVLHLNFVKRQHFFSSSYIDIMGESNFFKQSVSGAENLSAINIPSDSLKQNVLASVLAESVCKNKSRAEIASTIQFLQILCCLLKNYLY